METKEKLQEIIKTEGIDSVRKMIDEISSVDKQKLAKDWLIEQINGLIIDIKSNPDYIIYMKDVGYFWYEHKKCTLWVSWLKIWSILETKFGLKEQEILDLCGWVGEILKIKVDTTAIWLSL